MVGKLIVHVGASKVEEVLQVLAAVVLPLVVVRLTKAGGIMLIPLIIPIWPGWIP